MKTTVKTTIFGEIVIGKVVDENETYTWVEVVLNGVVDTYKKEKSEVSEVVPTIIKEEVSTIERSGKQLKVTTKTVNCLDGKVREFQFVEGVSYVFHYHMKDGKKFGKTFSSELNKLPKFITAEMLEL